MRKFTLLSLIILLTISGFFLIKETRAGTGENISGWAWSENIGWISFNCLDREAAIGKTCLDGNDPAFDPAVNLVDYGVNVDLGTGLFSGYAWSENIGWISFNSAELVGCPDGDCDARLDIDGTKCPAAVVDQVCGWARALAYGGGWDGWVKLRGTGHGVWLDTSVNEFRDWAWGGDDADEEAVIGWMSFNKLNCDTDDNGFVDVACEGDNSTTVISDYKVFIVGPVNLPPSATSLNVTQGDYCFISSPPIFLNWTYSDPDDVHLGTDPQSAYRVQVDNNSDFSSPEIDWKVISASTNYSPPGLSFTTTYFWRVMVWDGSDTPSIFAVGPSFATLFSPPLPDFTWSPPSPSAGEIIQFTDQTTFYYPGEHWAWDFGDGITCSSPPLPAGDCGSGDEQNPTHSYVAFGDYIVELTAAGIGGGGSCSVQQTLTTGLPLPEWREIAPTGLLEKFWASIFSFFQA